MGNHGNCELIGKPVADRIGLLRRREQRSMCRRGQVNDDDSRSKTIDDIGPDVTGPTVCTPFITAACLSARDLTSVSEHPATRGRQVS